MSAFICSDKHISAIVKWACRRNASVWFGNPSRSLRAGDEQELVDILYAENVKSVNYRYPASDPTPETGCVYDPDAPSVSPVEVLKLVQSLAYQSCEHPTWAVSDARQILDGLKSAAISVLPGYALAEWSI